jgi:hypothetical protein
MYVFRSYKCNVTNVGGITQAVVLVWLIKATSKS